ncbi:MAG: hypothetical protein AB7K71_31580 [Polyangiaceae bacterium]
MRHLLCAVPLVLSLTSIVACGSSDPGGSGGQGGGESGGAAGDGGSAGTSGSGGTAGGAGTAGNGGSAGVEQPPAAILNCPGDDAGGSLDGRTTDMTHPNRGWSMGDAWEAQVDVGSFYTWAWGSEFEPTPRGQAHFQGPSNSQYCAMDVQASLPRDNWGDGELQYRKFKSLGICGNAKGPTGTLEYCRANSNYSGALPEGCNADRSSSLRGTVGEEAIEIADLNLGGWAFSDNYNGPVTSAGLANDRGLILKFEGTETTPKRGFVRVPKGEDDGVIYCVTDAQTDFVDYKWDHVTLQVVRLGTCSEGADVGGEVAICL